MSYVVEFIGWPFTDTINGVALRAYCTLNVSDFVPIGTKPVWLSVEEVKSPKMPLPPKRKAL